MGNTVDKSVSVKIANMAFLCALFVVGIHCGSPVNRGSVSWFLSMFVFNGIAGIAVPFFFLISGYFLGFHQVEGAEYGSEVKKRIRSLLIPFYLWSVIGILFCLGLNVMANVLNGAALTRNLGGYPYVRLTGFSRELVLQPLWYVRTLFLLILLSPLIARLIRFKWWWPVPIAAIFAYLLISPELSCDTHPVKSFIRFVASPTGLLYFSAGMFLSRHRSQLAIGRSASVFALIFGFILLAVRAALPSVEGWSLAVRECAIPFLMLGIWGFVPSSPLPHVLSGLTFLIYVMHMLVIGFFELVLKRWGGESVIVERFDFYLLYVLASVMTTVLAAIFLKRCFPRVSNVLTGGR